MRGGMCEAGRAGPARVTEVIGGRELVDNLRRLRPGPDDAHLAPQHVQQLRQLVQAQAAKHPSHVCDSRVAPRRLEGFELVCPEVCYLRLLALRPNNHSSKLI